MALSTSAHRSKVKFHFRGDGSQDLGHFLIGKFTKVRRKTRPNKTKMSTFLTSGNVDDVEAKSEACKCRGQPINRLSVLVNLEVT